MPREDETTLQETAEISDRLLAEIIDLARLDPLEPGMARQKVHLRKILDQFRILRQVELEGVDPTIQINPGPIPLREDEVTDWFSDEEALANARLKTGKMFRAPKILGGEDFDQG